MRWSISAGFLDQLRVDSGLIMKRAVHEPPLQGCKELEGLQAGFADGDCFGFVGGWGVEGDFVEVFAGGGEHGAGAGLGGSAAVSAAEGADGACLADEGGVDGVEGYEDSGSGGVEGRVTLRILSLEALCLEVLQVGHCRSSWLRSPLGGLRSSEGGSRTAPTRGR